MCRKPVLRIISCKQFNEKRKTNKYCLNFLLWKEKSIIGALEHCLLSSSYRIIHQTCYILTRLFTSIIHVYKFVDWTDFSQLCVSLFVSLPLSARLFLHINLSRLFWLDTFNWYFPWSVNRIKLYARRKKMMILHSYDVFCEPRSERKIFALCTMWCILVCCCIIISCSIYIEGEAGTTPNSSPKIQFEKIVRKMRYMFQKSFDGFLGI